MNPPPPPPSPYWQLIFYRPPFILCWGLMTYEILPPHYTRRPCDPPKNTPRPQGEKSNDWFLKPRSNGRDR